MADFLLEKYKPMVKRQARTLYLIGGENEDLIQEGMIGLYPGHPHLSAREKDRFMPVMPTCA